LPANSYSIFMCTVTVLTWRQAKMQKRRNPCIRSAGYTCL